MNDRKMRTDRTTNYTNNTNGRMRGECDEPASGSVRYSCYSRHSWFLPLGDRALIFLSPYFSVELSGLPAPCFSKPCQSETNRATHAVLPRKTRVLGMPAKCQTTPNRCKTASTECQKCQICHSAQKIAGNSLSRGPNSKLRSHSIPFGRHLLSLPQRIQSF